MLRHILPGRIADGKEGGKEADQHKQKLCQHYTAAPPEIGFLLVNIALVNTYDNGESTVQDRCIYDCPLFSCFPGGGLNTSCHGIDQPDSRL